MTILSAGEKSVIPETHGRHVVDINVRDFWDPEAGHYTGHVGRHPRILEGLRNTNTTLLLRVLKQALDTIDAHWNNCVIVFRCRSNGHRSVACATLLALLCQLTDISALS